MVCMTGTNNDKSFSPDVLLHPDPLHKPLLKQQNVDKVIPTNQNTSVNLDIERKFSIPGRHHIRVNTETGQNIFFKI